MMYSGNAMSATRIDNNMHAKDIAGFPQRLENLENESSHGKVMEHETLAKSHGIL